MLTLAINTASRKTAIALLQKVGKSTKIISEKSWKSHNDEAEKLMPEIYNLLKASKFSFNDVSAVIVIKGPGSFTGLRIGVTVANTISYLNKCDLFGIDTFEYWREALGKEQKDTILLLYAGSGGVYANNEIINLDELPKYLKTKKIKNYFGEITKDQKSTIKNLKEIKIRKSFGKVMKTILEKELKPVKIIKPFYLKDPVITRSKQLIF